MHTHERMRWTLILLALLVTGCVAADDDDSAGSDDDDSAMAPDSPYGEVAEWCDSAGPSPGGTGSLTIGAPGLWGEEWSESWVHLADFVDGSGASLRAGPEHYSFGFIMGPAKGGLGDTVQVVGELEGASTGDVLVDILYYDGEPSRAADVEFPDGTEQTSDLRLPDLFADPACEVSVDEGALSGTVTCDAVPGTVDGVGGAWPVTFGWEADCASPPPQSGRGAGRSD